MTIPWTYLGCKPKSPNEIYNRLSLQIKLNLILFFVLSFLNKKKLMVIERMILHQHFKRFTKYKSTIQVEINKLIEESYNLIHEEVSNELPLKIRLKCSFWFLNTQMHIKDYYDSRE